MRTSFLVCPRRPLANRDNLFHFKKKYWQLLSVWKSICVLDVCRAAASSWMFLSLKWFSRSPILLFLFRWLKVAKTQILILQTVRIYFFVVTSWMRAGRMWGDEGAGLTQPVVVQTLDLACIPPQPPSLMMRWDISQESGTAEPKLTFYRNHTHLALLGSSRVCALHRWAVSMHCARWCTLKSLRCLSERSGIHRDMFSL